MALHTILPDHGERLPRSRAGWTARYFKTISGDRSWPGGNAWAGDLSVGPR